MEEQTPQPRPSDDPDDPAGSSSPDSGLCDLDGAVDPPKKKKSLLDPCLHDRRLTLLKSLSQDSEYSLDTSLFDAEEFLQDMGFAGCRDPTIPDRFLPSLMQRIARFPESEMESLHDRIIQSIGCFRRKEGKRRLFRNMSMGKDPRRWQLLGCPTPNHPLLRSNTDPSSFPYEDTSSATSSSPLLQSSGSSRLQSLGSSRDETEFPESPIAILVSAASVEQDQPDISLEQDQPDINLDQDQRDVNIDHGQGDDKGDQDDTCLVDAASQADLNGSDEFASTVEGIRKLTKEISIQDDDDFSQLDNDVYQPDDDVAQSYDDDSLLGEDVFQLDEADDVSKPDDNKVSQASSVISEFDEYVSQPKDGVSKPDYDVSKPDYDVSEPTDDVFQHNGGLSFHENNTFQTDNESNLIEINQETLLSENNHLSETKKVGAFDESSFAISETDVTHNFNSLKLINASVLNIDVNHVTNINRNVSESLESNGISSNTKTPLRRTSNAIFYNSKSLRTFSNIQNGKDIDDGGSENAIKEIFGIENGQYSIENEDSDVKLDELERALNGDTMFNETDKLNGDTKPKCLQKEFSINTTNPHNNCNNSIKPKYSRDDSLTNFLSSMLDTSDTTVTRPAIPIPNPFSEKNCNSDSEIPGSFASSPFLSFGAFDSKSKSCSSESPKTIQTTFPPLQNLKVKEPIEKAPNRKRRVLRRMSSSLQCCDDVNCNDPNELKVDYFSRDVDTSVTTSFLEANRLPKLVPESFKSVSSNHRAVHSCSSLPASSLYRACNARWENGEINKNVIGCQKQSLCCGDCDAKSRRNMSYFRKCKRRRNLSCPSPEINFNHSAWLKPNAVQCACMAYKHTSHFIENNGHTSLVLPCNVSQKATCPSCRCLDESSNCRLNLCCASSPPNIFPSANTGNCDSNARYIGPPSPFLLQPNNDVFTFGPNLWNQNRHLCYSSPDLRQECCSSQFEHCRQRSFTNLDECSFNSSLRGGGIDEVFFKDPCHCCTLRQHKGFDFDQKPTKTKISVRAPQRQNSMSVADSEIPTQSSTSFSSNKNVVKEPLPTSTIPNVCLYNGNRNNDYPSPCVPKASYLPDSISNKLTSDSKPPEIPSKLKTEETNEILPKSPSSPPTKSEALLERKIRIFSKFLANLGNLSKSVADTGIDNKHKRITRDQKSSDVLSSDKKTKSRALKVSCPATQSRKNSADFDKLLSLLKSMDLNNKNPENHKVLNENLEVSEECEEKLQENNYPVYENKVLLQASDVIGMGQHRAYKPVLYSSSVSLYINSEDKMDTQKNRNEKTDTWSDGDKEALSKEKYSTNRSSSQMPFRGVSKEIEDLQLSIQKAKEMRLCASKELHLLQELLSMDVVEENITKEKRSTGADSHRWEQESVSRSTDAKSNQALADLREKSKKEVLEDTSFWKEEIQKVKEETKQAWQSKLSRMEARLLAQEEELRRLQSDNSSLHRQPDPCRTTENGRTDSAFEDDEEYAKQPSTPIPSTRQECDRLQQRLMEEEQRADQLNLMLNQKLIELNKIQITLSKQTKEMIELEKSYLQLQCRLRKGTSKPVVSRLCSRASPFSPKNLCPKPSPPASPQPTNGTT